MQFNSSSGSLRTYSKSLAPRDKLWISQSNNMTSTGLMPPKSTVSHQSDGKTELETHHSETIFCDMISPDEWKSSLPLVFQQDDVCLLSNSPTSPSNSIEDLVLELENSQQDIGNPFSEYPDNLLHKVSSSETHDGSISAVPGSNDLLCELMETEQEVSINDQTCINNKGDKIMQEASSIQSEISVIKDCESEEFLQKSEPEIVILRESKIARKRTVIHLKSPSSHSASSPLNNKTTSVIANNLPQDAGLRSPVVPKKSKREPTKQVQKGSLQIEKKNGTSVRQLTNRLAKVIHCNNPDNVSIMQKATSTISTLRQQACDLMSTYSQLKFQNDELIHKQNKLQPSLLIEEPVEAQSKGPLTIEVLIPSAGTRKAFDSAPLYHHIPIEDCQIPLIADELNSLDDIIEEPYEEEYGAQVNSKTDLRTQEIAKVDQCKKLSCELGCICSSLTVGKLPVEHCKSPVCMLEPSCIHPQDPSHVPDSVKSLISVKEATDIPENQLESDSAIQSCNQQISTELSREDIREEKTPVLRSNCLPKKLARNLRRTSNVAKKTSVCLGSQELLQDKKLKQECFVRLVKLDSELLCKIESKNSVAPFDVKLQSKCYVQLNRLQTKSNQATFCMEHRLHRCMCLTSVVTVKSE